MQTAPCSSSPTTPRSTRCADAQRQGCPSTPVSLETIMDKKRWLALMIVPAVVALGVAFGAAEARSRSVDDCAAPRAVLARVGTVPVTQDDFRWASVQGRAAGSRLDPRSALRDLLWQEAERQRQRLP